VKMSELRENPTIEEWIDNINPVESTKYIYLQGMQAYTEFTSMTPEDLRAEAEAEISAGVQPSYRKIKKHMIGFRKHLTTCGLADHTLKARMMGVRSFYDSFEIELPKIKGERRKARTLEENNKTPTKEDIQAALKVCDPLERAIILVGASSGLASNEIRNLKINDFRRGYDQKARVTTLELRREKTGVNFVTFLSAEATQTVNEYLYFRDRDARAETARRKLQLDKQKIIKDDGYLFISRQVKADFLETGNEELRKLSENALQKLYRAISEKIRKNSKKGIYNVIRSHNMRKFFNSTLYNSECGEFYIEYWMGHSIDETRAAYFRANSDKLREIYLKYMPYLTIQKEADVSESPEYLRIRQENQILQVETTRHIVERSELQELRAEMEKMKEKAASEQNVEDGFKNYIQNDPELLEILLKKVKEGLIK
jgi:integrase